MFTAKTLRSQNIAEYVLYMWQIEDIIRANGLDLEKIRAVIVEPSPLTEEQKKKELQWYGELIDMMCIEGKQEKGHLQINQNILIELADLHAMLLHSPKFPDYSALFYQTLPIIVELRAKSGSGKVGEIETCFNALYGLLLMRLQNKQITEATQKAINQISKFISLLASYYHKDKIHPLFGKDDYGQL